jgi:hypothetical protein
MRPIGIWIIVTFVLSMLLAGTPAQAQVNIEKLRDEPPEGGFSSSFFLLFTTRSGNVDITQLSGNLRTDYVADRSTTFLILRGMYGWLSGNPFSNEGLVHLRHIYRHRGWIHPEVFGQVDYDEARKLEFRSIGGAGFRFNIVEKESVKMSWGTAYMLEYERFDLEPDAGHSKTETSHRWSNYLSLKIPLSDTSAIVWTAYVQPRFDDFEDLKTLSEGRIETELTDVLSLTIAARLRYDSAPPDGVVKRDTFLLTGIGIQF